MSVMQRTKIEMEHLITTQIIPEAITSLKNTMYWNDIRGSTWFQMSKHGERLYPFLKIAREIAVHGTDYGEVLDVAVITITRAGFIRTIIAIHHPTGVNLFLNVDNGKGSVVCDISTITENNVAHRPPVEFCGFWNRLFTRVSTINVWAIEYVRFSSLRKALSSYWKWRDNK